MASFKDILKQKQEQKERAERPKVDWFSLKPGETKYIRFLQEFDTDHRNYDSKFGIAQFLVEHVSPESWTRKALCSMEDEGRCFACEMNKEVEKIIDENGKEVFRPWKQRSNFYVYVIDDKSEIKVLSRPTNNKFFDALVDEIDENNNSLTDVTFKISKGTAKSDSWEIRKFSKAHFELPEISELVDLKTVVGLKVPYAEQRGFYLPESKEVSKEAPSVSTATDASRLGEDW